MFKKVLSVFMCAVSLAALSVTAFAAEAENSFDSIMNSYYYPKEKVPEGEFPKVLEEDFIVSGEKLIETFTTETTTKEELLALCKRLKSGERLLDNLVSRERLYTVTEDNAGNINGTAELEKEDFSAVQWGDLGEVPEDGWSRKDLRLSDEVKKNIVSSKVDLKSAKARYCMIESFALGALIYDGNSEYFIMTVRSIECEGILKLGEVYSVTDIVNIIENNIDTIFPINEVGEDGNPNTGAFVGAAVRGVFAAAKIR